MSCGMGNQSAAAVPESFRTTSLSITSIFWFDVHSQVSAWCSSFLLFLLLCLSDLMAFGPQDDNEMKARAWWNTIQLLRLSLMEDMSFLWGSAFYWAWPTRINSPKARSPFSPLLCLLISHRLMSLHPSHHRFSSLVPLSFPPFLPVAAINLEKASSFPK